jgi:predicted naringenin-chalcone synthase
MVYNPFLLLFSKKDYHFSIKITENFGDINSISIIFIIQESPELTIA